MTDRRAFLTQLSTSIVVLPTISFDRVLEIESRRGGLKYLSLVPVPSARLDVPYGKRIPLSLDYLSLDNSHEGLLLNIDKKVESAQGTSYLRLQVAIDTRERDEVEVYLANSKRKIGHLSIWYATALQLFETKLDAPISEIISEGLCIKLINGSKPLFFLASTAENGSHIMFHDLRTKLSNNINSVVLYSERSVQPFGWLEGCVLDGLQELYIRKRDKKALSAIRAHLNLFLKHDGSLIYEDPLGRPSDNQFNNLEAGLPFSVVARYYPSHPSMTMFLDYCKTRIDGSKSVKENSLTAEGCYTVAYPLAVVARELKRPEWYEFALIELEDRIVTLTDSEAVYTRARKDTGVKTYRNWGRGYTWFLLGLIRTAEILENDSPYKGSKRVAHLREVYTYYAQIALKHQQPDHSWRAYLDLDSTSYDSSATAGLGAALAHGMRLGWVGNFSENQLQQIRTRLQENVTPDGLIDGICQQNAAGEELQKSSYRVIAQYVLGLMAHIDAHLPSKNR
jgi:unsaturated rhamnogalacturonyl hydrolase